jgi:hypothetical protein
MKVHEVFFEAALSTRTIVVAGREESTGTTKPNVVEKKVSESAGSNASC